MRNKQFAKASTVAMLLGILVFLMSGPAQSKEPLKGAADFDRLMDAVAYGDKLWHTGESGKSNSKISRGKHGQ